MFRTTSKKIALIAGAVVVLVAIISLYAKCKPMEESAQPITFSNGNWDGIAAQAKKSGKYIFVDAYTTWCGPCRKLKDITFKDKTAVAFYNNNFINYSVDMEKGEGLQLADKWDVSAYPSLLFFTPDGKMIMRQIGYVDAKHLIKFGEEALTRK